MQFALIAAASTALLATSVNAHGYLVSPPGGTKDTTYNAKIDSSTLPAPYAGKKWNDNPTANAKMFADAFTASGEKSIKAMLDKAAPTCTPGVTTDVSSMKTLQWANDQEKKGFVTSHTGPCETWIDNVMVQHDLECVSKYPGYPANIPIDYSACKGKCTLTFYWLALHEPAWQVYKQCATITNGSGGGNGGNAGGNGGNGGGSAGNSTSPVPAPSTRPSRPSNPAPGPAPVPSSNPAPAPAPAPGKKPACKRRARN